VSVREVHANRSKGEYPLTRSYRFAAAFATVALAVGAATAFADHRDRGHENGHHGGTVLRAELFGSQPTGPVLFAVKPGGAPWAIAKGEAKVRRDGRVKVRIKGLVITAPPQNGTNPLSNIAATVFCSGSAVGTTQAVPFSPTGDARIDETLATPLSRPCLAPAVLLNPAPGGAINAGTYIAATGA
jgi:hypothetical protein